MKKIIWTGVVVAIICGGGAFYAGMQYQASQTPARPTAGSGFAGRTGTFGSATFGTILSIDSGSLILQLPNSTSTTATIGTNIVLFDSATSISQLNSLPSSNLAVGQSIVVAGTANSDGSITASTIQIRPASSLRNN